MFESLKKYFQDKTTNVKAKHLSLLFLIIISLVSIVMVIDLKDHGSLLQFRTSHSAYSWWNFCHADRTGLDTLHVSGSGVLHEKAVRKSFQDIGPGFKNIYVVNLTTPDMLYANGRPFRWFNWKQRKNGTIRERYNRAKSISHINENLKWYLRRQWYPRPADSLIETEEQMLNRLGYHYAAFYVDRHEIFPPLIVDQFLTFVEQLPPHAWVHFHCDGGNSRTTTMMIFYDILKNGKTVPLETIMERQHGLGGVNVMNTTPYLIFKGTWKHANLMMRKAMIEDFYRYVNDPKGYGTMTWSHWFAINGTAQKFVLPVPEKKKKGKKKKEQKI